MSPAPRPPAAVPGAPIEEPPPIAAARPDLDAPRAPAPQGIDDLLPPEDIPTVGSIERPRQRRGASERSVFEQLFGGG
jgi:penicillin-binding protein 1A